MAEKITIARPYAKAVFELAQREQNLSRWSRVLKVLADAVAAPAVAALIDAPEVAAAKRAEIIIEICGDMLDERGRNLLRLLSEKRRLDYLPEIAAEFERLRAAAEAIVDVELAAPIEIDPERRSEVEAALKRRLGHDVRVHYVLDEALLGGAVIRAGDLVIDGSIRGRLERLAAAMSH
ncbi:MAG TPA: F0F1 ATP synthase subunit delta [Gammaproteobacteria bacterium]|nr:F0F1 ATP synthase subunit delta [Gammaproteobacteria bacterium]